MSPRMRGSFHTSGSESRSAASRRDRAISEAMSVITEQLPAFIQEAGASSAVMAERIIGCPHEQGIDYRGPTSPICSFLVARDRSTGRRPQSHRHLNSPEA